MKAFTKGYAINRISELHKIISELLEEINDYKIQTKKLLIENSNLKHIQNIKAIEELEKLKKFYSSTPDWDWLINTCVLEDYINNQITELKK